MAAATLSCLASVVNLDIAAVEVVSTPPAAMASTQQRRRSSGQGPVKRGGARNKKEDKEMKEPPELTSEQLEAIYTNKEYEPPAPGALEAIFEKEAAVKRRGATEELVLGKNLSRRVMKFPEYWVEDKAKTRHRAKMTAKAHKGRQKFHLVALTDQEKEKLDNLILESEDLSGRRPQRCRRFPNSHRTRKPRHRPHRRWSPSL